MNRYCKYNIGNPLSSYGTCSNSSNVAENNSASDIFIDECDYLCNKDEMEVHIDEIR